MSAPIRLYVSMSLDGYVAGPDDRAGQELGRGGGRLFDRLDDRTSPGINGQVYGEVLATGAVISGRRTFELAGRWNGDHHGGVPVLVLTSAVDDGDVPPGSARSCTDVAECAAEARAAAGDRAVTAPAQRTRCCRPAGSTRWGSTWSRSCRAPAAACSRTAPTAWSWSSSGGSTAAA